jgi:hypothetical protein
LSFFLDAALAHLVDSGVVFPGDRFSKVDDRAAHCLRHAVERLDPEGYELGQLVDVPRLRPRDDVVGPGQARRFRDARQVPEAAATVAALPASVWIRM